MRSNYKKIGYLALSFLMMNSAFAMKRAAPDDESLAEKKARTSIVPENQMEAFDYFPDEVIILISENLGLNNIRVSFVNKRWLNASLKAFPHFYQFQETYHRCQVCFSTDQTEKNAINMLKALRKSEKLIEKQEEKTALANTFLLTNFDSIKEIATTPNWLRLIELRKYPQRWAQLALLRIWDHIQPISSRPIDDYSLPCLKILANIEELKNSFDHEPDFSTKCDFASELCERGSAEFIVMRAADYARQNRMKDAAEFYEIALNKDPNAVAPKDSALACEAYNKAQKYPQRAGQLADVALQHYPKGSAQANFIAAQLHMKTKNFPRAAELFEIGFKKDPKRQRMHIYLNALVAYANLEDSQKTLEFAKLALKEYPDIIADANALDYLLYAYYKINNFQGIVELSEIALQNNPSLTFKDYGIVVNAFVKLNKLQRASEILDFGLNNFPNAPKEAYQMAIDIFRKLNKIQRATELQDIAVKKYGLKDDCAEINKLGG